MKRCVGKFVATIIVSILFSLGINLSAFSQNTESITLTTYYPSPVGVYRELRAQRQAIGENYYDASQYPWDTDGTLLSNEIPQNTTLVVEGNLGIGTNAPKAKLHVAGNIYLEQEPANSDVRIYTSAGENLIFNGTDGWTVLTPNTNGFRVANPPSGASNVSNSLLVTPVGTGIYGNLVVYTNATSSLPPFGVVKLNQNGTIIDTYIYAHVAPRVDKYMTLIKDDTYIMSRGMNVDAFGVTNLDGSVVYLNVTSTTGNTTIKGNLAVGGAIKLGDTSTACGGAINGTMRYRASKMEYCNGTAWIQM